MKTLCLCCILSVPQLVYAAAPEGDVIQWGWNTAAGVAAPPKVVLSNTVAVSASSGHCLALRKDGTVVGWGDNYFGEATGVPTTNYPYFSAGQVSVGGQTLSNVVSIVASREFSLALRQDGTVVTWGENYAPTGLSNITAIAVDQAHSWALKRDGTVVGWWREPSPSYNLLTVAGLSNVVNIAVGPGPQGGTRGVALMRGGTVRHWGSESTYKHFTTSPAGLSNVVAVAAGAGHSLALKSDGTVVGWGDNSFGQATGVPTTNAPNISSGHVIIGGQVLSNVTSIAAGAGYSLALKRDGAVVAWGRMVYNLYPPDPPVGLSNVIAISAGANDFCLAITTNSQVAARFLQKK